MIFLQVSGDSQGQPKEGLNYAFIRSTIDYVTTSYIMRQLAYCPSTWRKRPEPAFAGWIGFSLFSFFYPIFTEGVSNHV